LEQRGQFPGTDPDEGIDAGREGSRDVVDETAAGDVGEGADDIGFAGFVEASEEGLDEGTVGDMDLEEFVAEGAVESGGAAGDLQAELIEEDLAGEGIAIGMEAGRGHADEDIAAADGFLAVEHPGFLDDADDGAGDVVFAVLVEAGHLGGFAADEGAAIGGAAPGEAGDDVFEDGGLEFSGAEIIEEEEGFGAEDGDVIDAMVDEVFADGVVTAGEEGDLQFGADAVDGRDEDGIGMAPGIEGEEAAETADLAHDSGTAGGGEQLGEGGLDAIAEVNIHAGCGVSFLLTHCGLQVWGRGGRCRVATRGDGIWKPGKVGPWQNSM